LDLSKQAIEKIEGMEAVKAGFQELEKLNEG
jgi:hypothetical protein